jgi:GntR family transcriptional regulator/MocR family aminotransferase
MARWEFAVALDRTKDRALFKQIAMAISHDIRRGRLRPGDRLPGARTLARSLGVQRLTVVSAFDELTAEGWVVTYPARGAFVSPSIPEAPRPRRFSAAVVPRSEVPSRLGFDLRPPPPLEIPYDVPRGALLFAPNRPDVRLLPGDLIGRAYRRAIRSGGQVLLAYGRPQGHEHLRTAIAGMLAATRGLSAKAEDVCITRGSQMGIALLARALVGPGDVVAVEELSHRPAAETFLLQGATLAPIPMDEEGMRIEPLERLARAGGLRAVHVTPHHQFPTTVMLSAARRLRLLELARTYRFAVIEEDVDHEFHYDGRPVFPLASADHAGVVAYVGTFSKVLAPGMRIGYVVAPPALIASVAAHRLHIDVQGDRVLEYALAELIEQGEVQRHVRRVRREYGARRDALVEALRKTLGDALSFAVPAGGIGLWVKAADGLDMETWAARARQRGAIIATAASFSQDRKVRPFARLGFASLDRQEILEGVRRLAAACPRRSRPASRRSRTGGGPS